MEAYSRDAMAEPLRHLVATLAKIRGGRFRPDLTRSGYLADRPASATSSAPASASSLDPDVVDTDDENIKDVIDTDDDVTAEFCMNKRSGFIHVIAGSALACGKAMPVKHDLLVCVPPEVRRCSRCF